MESVHVISLCCHQRICSALHLVDARNFGSDIVSPSLACGYDIDGNAFGFDVVFDRQVAAEGVAQEDEPHHRQEVLVAGVDRVRGQQVRRTPKPPLDRLDLRDRAGSVDQVAAAMAELPGSVARMLGDGAGPHEAGRVVATVTDRVQRKLLDLAVADLGRPEGRFAWLCFGSQARREQTVLTDQDTGLVLPAGADDGEDAAWAAVAAWVTDALERVGYPRCRGGVMASEPLWRHDLAGWHARLDALDKEADVARRAVGFTLTYRSDQ